MSATNSDIKAPLMPIAQDDHGGYVVLTTFASSLVTLLFCVVRLTIRIRHAGFQRDDGFLMAAAGFTIAQSVCMQLSVNAGLGRRSNAEELSLSRFEKLYYTSALLEIVAQACAKASVNVLFHSLRPFQWLIVASKATIAITAAWMLGSCLAMAFQCDLPYPWHLMPEGCADLQAVSVGVDVANIFSEACIILLPVALMPRVQSPWSVRLLVISSFAARMVVIAALIAHIAVTLDLPSIDPTDIRWQYTTPTIWTQVTMNLSVLTACIPGMQRVLTELPAGMTSLTVRSAYSSSSSPSGLLVFGSSDGRSRPKVVSNRDSKTWELARENAGSAWGLTATSDDIRRKDHGREG